MLKSGIYDFVICRGGTDMCFILGFGRKRPDLKQYRIAGLTITDTRIQHLIQSTYKCLNTIHQRKIHVWVQTTIICLVEKVKHTMPTSTWVQALRRGPLAS